MLQGPNKSKNSFGPSSLPGSFQRASSVPPGNSLLGSLTAAKSSSTRERPTARHLKIRCSAYATALAAMTVHLAKIYLFDQEYKSYLGSACFYKWKCEDCYRRYFFSHGLSLWSTPGISSLTLHILSQSRFLVIPSKQGIQGTCSGHWRCYLSHPLIFSCWVTCTQPSNCHLGYRPLSFSFGRSGLVPPIT